MGITLILLVASAVSATPAGAEQPHPFAGNRVATIMTQNLYVGTDLGPAVTAPNLGALVAAVAAAYGQIQDNDFPARAAAMAQHIDRVRPDLVGLQEASILRTDTPADGPATPATVVTYDYVQTLIEKLAERGLRYEVVAVLQASDGESPSALGFDVRLTDRIAMLARADLSTADLKLSNVRTGHFADFLEIPSLGGPIQSRRGWISVDAKIRGRSFRFITTHLEPIHPGIRAAQANELVSGPANTSLPVVMAGDFNTRADGTGTPIYNALMAAGFADAWSQTHSGDHGYTCCHATDLRVPGPPLDERLDLVLTRGGLAALSAEVLGTAPGDPAPPVLWSSDHAGVAARLSVP